MKFSLENLFKMQDNLNKFTAGDNWKKGYNQKGMKLNYARFASYELVELGESFNLDINSPDYGVENDIENIKVELVDILHFIVSLCQMDYVTKSHENIQEDIFETFNESINKEISNDMNILMMIDLLIGYLSFVSFRYSESMDGEVITIRNLGLKDHIDNTHDSIESIIHDIVGLFILISRKYMTVDELLGLYVKKCQLNYLRQRRGYTNKSYIKEWNIILELNNEKFNIKEDNEILKFIDSSNKNINIIVNDKNIHNEIKNKNINLESLDEVEYTEKFLDTVYDLVLESRGE